MKSGILFSLFFLVMVTLAGCSSPDSRIKDNQAEFDTYPPETQEMIRQGQVTVGFTETQTRMALGDPDRIYTRTTAAGQSHVWAYADNSPSIGFGVGVGAGRGGSTRLGTGVGMSTLGDRWDDNARVVFDENGKVTAVEMRE